jgi:hypothetical protein
VTVAGGERRRDVAVGVDDRAQLVGLRGREHAARDVQRVLQGDRRLEQLRLLVRAEEEEVADAVEPEGAAGGGVQAVVRLQAAGGERDVQGVRELTAKAADRLAGRAAAQLGRVEQDDVGQTVLGEVVGDADADDAAADDDDLRALGQGLHASKEWHRGGPSVSGSPVGPSTAGLHTPPGGGSCPTRAGA